MTQSMTLMALDDFKTGDIGYASNGAVISPSQRPSLSYGQPVRAAADVRVWRDGVFEPAPELEFRSIRS
jgi:hypothetical protein